MKICTKCGRNCKISNFSSDNRREKIGYKSWCKTCCQVYHSKYKLEHRQRTKNIRKKYKDEWINFFISIYGKNPKCEICYRRLKWFSQFNKFTPNFDHRHGGNEPIIGTPAAFWGGHACTKKNKTIWLECDFGILCSYCNFFLPTKSREQWLENVIRYVKNS